MSSTKDKVWRILWKFAQPFLLSAQHIFQPSSEMSNWLFGISGLVIIEMTKLTHWDFDFITCIYSAGSDYEDGPGRKIHFSRRWKVWIRSLRWRKRLWWCSGWQNLCEGIKGLRRKVWTLAKILIINIPFAVAILRFVTFYAQFGRLWAKKCFFLGQQVFWVRKALLHGF